MRLGFGLGFSKRGVSYPPVEFPPATSGLIGFYDSDATNGHTYVGSNVTQFTDLTGNGNHLTAGGTPQTGTRTINSLNAIDLNGSTDYFIMPSGIRSALTGGSYSIYVIAKPDVKADQYLWFAKDGTLSSPQGRYAFAGDVWFTVSGNASASVSITHNTNQHAYGVIRNGANFYGFYDATNSSSASAANSTSTEGYFGVGNPSGSFGTHAELWFDGAICSIAIYNTNHDNTTRDSVLDFFSARWGTP